MDSCNYTVFVVTFPYKREKSTYFVCLDSSHQKSTLDAHFQNKVLFLFKNFPPTASLTCIINFFFTSTSFFHFPILISNPSPTLIAVVSKVFLKYDFFSPFSFLSPTVQFLIIFNVFGPCRNFYFLNWLIHLFSTSHWCRLPTVQGINFLCVFLSSLLCSYELIALITNKAGPLSLIHLFPSWLTYA